MSIGINKVGKGRVKEVPFMVKAIKAEVEDLQESYKTESKEGPAMKDSMKKRSLVGKLTIKKQEEGYHTSNHLKTMSSFKCLLSLAQVTRRNI